MLVIRIAGQEFYNESTQEFSIVNEFDLHLEHSLFSMSKWESKFLKPFLNPLEKDKPQEEIMGYIEAMILDPIYPEDLWERFTQQNFDAINSYIASSQSATVFGILPEHKGRGEVITSELIYYWMIAFNIPFECERWHLNRLFALIRICNIKNGKQKKMSKGELAQRYQQLNAERRAKLGTSG